MDYFRLLGQMLQDQGRGGDTLLAHITPGEAALLKRRGGSGTRNPVTGLLEFYDADGSGNASDSSDPSGSGSSDGGGGGSSDGKSGEMSASISDAGGAAQGYGGGEKSGFSGGPPASLRGFGQAPYGPVGGMLGTMTGFATGVPGLGLAGAALGTLADVRGLNQDLAMMGLPANVEYGPALASNLSFGLGGRSAVDQFGNIVGFDAFAEAPLSSYSVQGSVPAAAADANGASDGAVRRAAAPAPAPSASSAPPGMQAQQFGVLPLAAAYGLSPVMPFMSAPRPAFSLPDEVLARPVFNLASAPPAAPASAYGGGLLSDSLVFGVGDPASARPVFLPPVVDPGRRYL